jgi:hypothetical protein
MCLVLAFASAAAAYWLFQSGSAAAGTAAAATALLFAGLMMRNILKIRQERHDDR